MSIQIPTIDDTREIIRDELIQFKTELAAMTSKPVPEIMTLTEVCEYTRFTRQTIRSFIKEKAFPVSYPCDSPRFIRKDVDAWLRKQTDIKSSAKTSEERTGEYL